MGGPELVVTVQDTSSEIATPANLPPYLHIPPHPHPHPHPHLLLDHLHRPVQVGRGRLALRLEVIVGIRILRPLPARRQPAPLRPLRLGQAEPEAAAQGGPQLLLQLQLLLHGGTVGRWPAGGRLFVGFNQREAVGRFRLVTGSVYCGRRQAQPWRPLSVCVQMHKRVAGSVTHTDQTRKRTRTAARAARCIGGLVERMACRAGFGGFGWVVSYVNWVRTIIDKSAASNRIARLLLAMTLSVNGSKS